MKNTWPVAIAIFALAGAIVFYAFSQRFSTVENGVRIDRMTGETSRMVNRGTGQNPKYEWVKVQE